MYEWTNGVPINISYIGSLFHDSTNTGFFGYMLAQNNPALGISTSSSTSNGVCEYFE